MVGVEAQLASGFFQLVIARNMCRDARPVDKFYEIEQNGSMRESFLSVAHFLFGLRANKRRDFMKLFPPISPIYPDRSNEQLLVGTFAGSFVAGSFAPRSCPYSGLARSSYSFQQREPVGLVARSRAPQSSPCSGLARTPSRQPRVGELAESCAP